MRRYGDYCLRGIFFPLTLFGSPWDTPHLSFHLQTNTRDVCVQELKTVWSQWRIHSLLILELLWLRHILLFLTHCHVSIYKPGLLHDRTVSFTSEQRKNDLKNTKRGFEFAQSFSPQILRPAVCSGAQVPLLWKPGNWLCLRRGLGWIMDKAEQEMPLLLQICLTFTWKDAFDKGSLFGGSVKLCKLLLHKRFKTLSTLSNTKFLIVNSRWLFFTTVALIFI